MWKRRKQPDEDCATESVKRMKIDDTQESTKNNMGTKDNNQLSEYQDKDSEEERWKMTFDRHHDFIVDRMSPDFGLIDKLYSNSAITEDEKEEIETERVVRKRNENLITRMRSKCQLRKFVEVLEESDQKHLVKYLENDGNHIDVFDGEWPLTEKEILTIKISYESLIDLIEISDLLGPLYSTGVVNKRQRELISSKSTSYEKNKALLEILRRGSLRSYWQTIRCLRQSNQSHIAEILETGGVAVRMDANLEMENMDIGRLEEEIALQINNLLRNRSIRVLELKLIAGKKGHSVSLYFLCNQSTEVDYLEKVATDGRLKEFAELLFNALIKTQKTIEITLKWTPDVFVRCREAIQDLKNSRISKISMGDLPLELTDIILQKSYLRSILNESQSSQNQEDEVAIKLLASVDFCWYQRISRKHFKSVVWSKLKKYYEDNYKSYLIYKNNRHFFEEVLRISGKRNMTLSTDYLSNSETVNGKRKRSPKKRQTAIQIPRTAFFLATKNGDRSLKSFIRHFDPTEQRLIFDIFHKGGGAARVEMKMSCPMTKLDLIRKKIEDGVKILRSLADRDAVVWIWCHSNNALQKLNNRDGLKKLIEIVHQSVKAKSKFLEHKTNIDCDHLKKKIVNAVVDRLNVELQKDRLIELIDCEFGLFDKLLSRGALTEVKIAKVKSEKTLFEKNKLLLNYIFSENKHQDLMEALLDCDQDHVVNWVRGNGEYEEKFGFDWPLRETEEKVLDYNQGELVVLLDADEILPKLYAVEVINERQRDSIGSKPTERERSEAIFDAVRRFSLKSFFTFKKCLRQSGQSHVADILDDDEYEAWQDGLRQSQKNCIIGFVHDVQGKRKSRRGHDFLSFYLQSGSEFFERCLSFSPGLHEASLRSFQENRQPVCIGKFTYKNPSEGYNEPPTMMLTEHSYTGKLLNEKDIIKFRYKELPIVFTSLDQLSIGKYINVRIRVISQRNVESKLVEEDYMDFQEKVVRDENGNTAMLSAWGELVDTISPEAGLMEIKDVSVKEFQNVKYLSTNINTTVWKVTA